MNKEDSLWLKFEAVFVFVDLKVVLLIIMIFNFYKETVLLADVIDPHKKALVVDVLYRTWEQTGSGYWKWIIAAVLGDIVVKSILRKLNE